VQFCIRIPESSITYPRRRARQHFDDVILNASEGSLKPQSIYLPAGEMTTQTRRDASAAERAKAFYGQHSGFSMTT